MWIVVASILLTGAAATPRSSITGRLNRPQGNVIVSSKNQRSLFQDLLFGGGGDFEDLFVCGDTCTDDKVCNSLFTTFDPTIVEDACNTGCFPKMQLSTCEHFCNTFDADVNQTIVELGMGNEDLSTLVAALEASDLVGTLTGPGPFTVFAPTNSAFGALSEGTVDSLLLPENIEKLQDILKYHVVAASAPSLSLTSGVVDTLSGDTITLTVSDKGIMVNNANVITADILASNGIIHVIDAVLIPLDDPEPATPASAVARFFDTAALTDVICSQCKFFECCVVSDDDPPPRRLVNSTKYDTCKGYLDDVLAASESAIGDVVDSISLLLDPAVTDGGHSSELDGLEEILGDLFVDTSVGSGQLTDGDTVPMTVDGMGFDGLLGDHFGDTSGGAGSPTDDTVDTTDDVLPSLLDGLLNTFGDLFAGTGGFTVSQPTDETLPDSACAFCTSGLDNPSEVLPEVAGDATCQDAQTYASSLMSSNDMCSIVKLAEELCCKGNPPMTVAPAEEQTIVDIAVGNEDFSTLVAAVTAAGMVDTLAGPGPFTVFAPTNEAFAALDPGTIDSLLLPENNGKLQEILKYHVVAASAPSSSLVSGGIATLSGGSVFLSVLDEAIMVNDANVITADIEAINGIIHVIDKVLFPPEGDANEEPVEEPADSETTPTTDISTETVASTSAENTLATPVVNFALAESASVNAGVSVSLISVQTMVLITVLNLISF